MTNETIVYMVADIFIALCCISSLIQAWRKGLVRMLIEALLFVASLTIAVLAAGFLASRFDIYAHYIHPLDVFNVLNAQTCNWILWFCASFIVLQIIFTILLRLMPYGKVKGVFSLANHLMGLGIGVIIVSANILILTAFLNTNPIINMQPFLEHSWLRPACELIQEKAMWIESEVAYYVRY